MRAACCQDRPVRLEVPVPNHNDAVTKLAVKPLIIQLLEELLKVPWKIHDPIKKENNTLNTRKCPTSVRGCKKLILILKD